MMFIAIVASSILLSTTTSTLALVSNDASEFPSSAPSDAPWSAPSNGAAAFADSVGGSSTFDETPDVVPATSSPVAPTSTSYQLLESNIFTTSALDSNTTDVIGLAGACAAPPSESMPCDSSRTCTSIGHPALCCSQWGYCGSTVEYCGACCLGGPCWASPPTTSKPSTSKPTTTTATSTSKPTSSTTSNPTTTTATSTSKPTSPRPTTARPASRRPTTARPTTRKPTCSSPFTFTFANYDAIDADVANLKNAITSTQDRTHFLGGIVRLAAHDFMDFNAGATQQMGADGCFNATHPNNAGLSTIWCDNCVLTKLHKEKYNHISKADFWVASANAVIRQTSIDPNNVLNLRSTFRWGRVDATSCVGSGTRLPIPSRCSQVELVFLTRMGLDWKDAVALLGAHTLGRGNRAFSSHHGTWKDNNQEAQVFDKQYYRELLDNNWRMIFTDGPQDWTTGDLSNERLMLNTDICLAYDIDDEINGSPRCTTGTTQNVPRCPVYGSGSTRLPALNAVHEFGDAETNDPFYEAFSLAWNKATAKQTRTLKNLGSC